MNILRLLTVLFVSLVLAGCGFTLRGNAELPATLQPLHLDNINDSSAMGRELLRVMVSNKVALAGETGATVYSLALGAEKLSERAISVNANARAGEYEIILTVPFQLKRGNAVAIPQQVVSLTKVYLADPENAVAKSEEAVIIQNEMRQEVAQLILRRLQAFKP